MSDQQKFALFFMGGEVQFLISDSNVAGWALGNAVQIDAPEFNQKICDFRDHVIEQTNGQNLVAVFLAEPDICVSKVSVWGRTPAERQSHVTRTLARLTQDSADNVVALIGTINLDRSAPVVYAALDTLTRAQEFLKNYGLNAAYFAPLNTPKGFKQQARLLNCVAPPFSLYSRKARVVQRAYVGSVVAMACAVVTMFGTAPTQSAVVAKDQTQITMAYSSRPEAPEAQSQPKQRSAQPTGVGAPVAQPAKFQALPMSHAEQIHIARGKLSISGADEIEPVASVSPSGEDLKHLDAVLVQGLFVEIGMLKNLTLATARTDFGNGKVSKIKATFADLR